MGVFWPDLKADGEPILKRAISIISGIHDFPVSYQVKYVRDFLLSEGSRYTELIPNAELVTPDQAGDPSRV